MLTQIALAVSLAAVLTTAAGPLTQDASPKPAAQTRESSPPLNLNAATADQLEALPGIGAATAARILEYRQKNGPFKKVEDLMNVKGIGEKSFLKLKPLVTVAPARATD